MQIESITRLAKRAIIKTPNQSPPLQTTRKPFTFLRSYFTLLTTTTTTKPPSSLQNPPMYSDRVLPKSMYSSSAPQPEKKGFIGWYLRMLENRPILTKAVSSSLIYAAADITAQVTMSASDSIDFVRVARIASFGFFILGPSQHYWFSFIANVLPKRDVISTLKKILMGQLIFGPFINSVFFSFNAGLQGENGHQISARLKRDLLPTLLSGLMYWPICDFLTYKIIPVRLMPLINSSFAYFWSIYLTYMAGLEKAD